MVYPLILSLILFPIYALSQTEGNVAVGTTLTADGESTPWLSPSGDFAFGFRQLQDKDKFMLAVWYNKIPDQTMAWFQSKRDPIPRGSTVRVDARDGLVILDPRNQTVLWVPDDVNIGRIDHGFMNDTGNFVLKGSSGEWMWETFRFAVDTILPLQELRAGNSLSSRLSEMDFSQGRFSVRFRDDGNLVLICQSVPENTGDGIVYYSSSTSDARNLSNSGSRAVFDRKGFLYVRMKNNQTTQVTPVPDSPDSEYYFRARLEFDGVFILYSHPRNLTGDPKWAVVWSVPENICLNLIHKMATGACGYNSICSLEGKRPVCNCPKGYDSVDPNNKYGNCKPSFTPTCDGVTKWQIFEDVDVDWPESDYQFTNTGNEAMCKQSCLEDCLCAVAIFRDSNCLKKKLPLSNGRRNATVNSKAFIKFSSSGSINPSSNTRSKGKRRMTAAQSAFLGTSLLLNIVLIGSMFLGCFFIRRKNKPNIQAYSTAMEGNLRCFTFKQLAKATSEFEQELGRGSYGVVYKGEVAHNSVAVKKLNRLAQEKEFRAEVNSISMTNHKNLVRLLGFCDEEQNRLLVYEYMSNGSLDSFIFSTEKPSWTMRKHIAIGIARGLVYLHDECSVQIIHCDIKPQNILLDDHYNVRISDFGLAKLLNTSQSKVSLTNVRGTRGYVAPEWFRNSQITAKVDVYSFGVLLLEIVSCRKCIEQVEMSEEEKDWRLPLTDLAWDLFEEKSLDKLVGNDSEALKDEMVLERFVMVGIWCIQENATVRPTMRKVCQMLEGIVVVETPPCPSPFF